MNTNVSSGGDTIIVDMEDASLVIFRSGASETIWITDGVNSEYITNIISVTPAGAQVTIVIAGTLVNSYLAASTVVASVIEIGDVEALMDSWNETVAGAADYDETTYPLELDNIGTVEDNWTVTVDAGATTFSVVGSQTGAITGGTIGLDYAPSNDDFIKPYFTLEGDGWGSSWLEGDTIQFSTHPAAVPIWNKRVIPAGSASQSSDGYTVRLTGETS